MPPVLTPAERELLESARRATLATIAGDGRPRLVPVCFVLIGDVVWSPIDEKPKSVDDVRSLARVRDILGNPRASILVDRWSEDWADLGWVRLSGHASVVDSDEAAVAALRAKYPQYADHDLEARPMIRFEIARASSWTASPADRDATAPAASATDAVPTGLAASPPDRDAPRRPVE
ncbi:MAG: TIGR03668 family PPOX class F420-dependent oxidoreductase [Chloroflexota bacterium]